MIFRAVEDADLISRVRKGDVEAFNLLVSRWEKRVFNYLLRLTGNPDDSLDLSQDVFLKAYQNIRKLDDTARFGPWLFRIAHNEAYSLFRKRRPEVSERKTHADRARTRPRRRRRTSPSPSPRRSAASPRNSAKRSSSRSMKASNSRKWREILGTPVSTIKSRLYTALDLLKTELAPTNTRGIR